ncbi:unnamed protein product [Durusdinium trenchii]|uniref:Cysteine synthase n=1 Tax=Durusdinium trenchii TaxID=1381693 RepID=A0ABP0RVB0_9DINO
MIGRSSMLGRRCLSTSTARRALYNNICETVGSTPTVKVNRLAPAKVNLYVKLEYFNPLASVKDRLAVAIIEDAEKKGELKPGGTVVEATSGNTGIALAMVCAQRGYNFVCTMAASFSVERRKVMRMMGAKVVVTPAPLGGTGMVLKAEELAEKHGWFLARQFENEAGPEYHAKTTGPEILKDFEGKKLDYWVTGYGTGGTFQGAGGSTWSWRASQTWAEEELPRPLKRGGRFMNPWTTPEGQDPCEKRLRDVAPPKSTASTDVDARLTQPVDWAELRRLRQASAAAPVAVWLGHASVLGFYGETTVLFDPVFSERSSPFSFVGPKRYTPSVLRRDLSDWPEDLAPHVVAISHAHYDHLDEETVRRLAIRFPKVQWLAPLGLGEWFQRRKIEVTEMDWWQEFPLDREKQLTILALPAQHWANRWPWDRNCSLWCGYGLVHGAPHEAAVRDMPLCFLGDTGYCPVFRLLGSLFRIQLAAVPIGAYHPRWFMSPSHCDPYEAVQIVEDLKSQAALAIHWGTFPLTAEPYTQQLAELRDARQRAQALGQSAQLRALPVGGHMLLDSNGADLADLLAPNELRA